jgi:hypothetical protein
MHSAELAGGTFAPLAPKPSKGERDHTGVDRQYENHLLRIAREEGTELEVQEPYGDGESGDDDEPADRHARVDG